MRALIIKVQNTLLDTLLGSSRKNPYFPSEGKWKYGNSKGWGKGGFVVRQKKYGANLEFSEGWGANQKTLFGGGSMGMLWNQTFA